MFRLHRKCRACGNTTLTPVFDLGLQYPANDFKTASEERLGAAPLKVLFCEKCTLAQLSATVCPRLLYKDYPYVTSTSDQMRQHFQHLWASIVNCGMYGYVVEVGSNDGGFLEYCGTRGATKVMGFDAAENLADIARGRGVPTWGVPFSESTAVLCCDEHYGKPDVIVARHVFAHIDDWRGFVWALDRACGPNTTVVIEVPYAADTLWRCEWDQLYSEHLSYVSLKSMHALLAESPFEITDVRRFKVHGGVVALFIHRKGSGVSTAYLDMLAMEDITTGDWLRFGKEAKAKIDSLRLTIRGCASKKVVGFGASAKSSVWIQSCGFSKDQIRFICDNTPFKQGKLSPGTDIPIVPESELTRDKADVAINFAWQYHDEILKKHKAWLDAGGRFINPHHL